MPSDKLEPIASSYFKSEQIEVMPDLKLALRYALEKASLANQVSDGVSAVVVTGSVLTAGEARGILREFGEKI
jgi:dihydrofolate synthase/folylpolyglutamate synthase